MDKKNTMLLTVIAVATLLVAVVGATFAYFAVANESSSATAAVNVSTENIGVVSLSKETEEMHIRTVASDFSQALGGTANGKYYATKTAANFVNSAETNNVVVIGATGGEENTVYECSFTLTAVTTGLPETGLVAGDYVVTVGGIGSLGNLDMATVDNRNVSKEVTVYLTGETPKYITASAVLVNSDAEQQEYLAGKTIKTEFNASGLSCDVVTTAGTDSLA